MTALRAHGVAKAFGRRIHAVALVALAAAALRRVP